MMKLAIILLLAGCAAASGICNGYGCGGAVSLIGNAYDGIDNLGLAYNQYDLTSGRLGLGYGYGIGRGLYGYGIGRGLYGYGLGNGLGYGNGLGCGPLGC